MPRLPSLLARLPTNREAKYRTFRTYSHIRQTGRYYTGAWWWGQSARTGLRQFGDAKWEKKQREMGKSKREDGKASELKADGG